VTPNSSHFGLHVGVQTSSTPASPASMTSLTCRSDELRRDLRCTACRPRALVDGRLLALQQRDRQVRSGFGLERERLPDGSGLLAEQDVLQAGDVASCPETGT
jgi:hypothetical protein